MPLAITSERHKAVANIDDGPVSREQAQADKRARERYDDWLSSRFDLYGALWLLCSRWHSGQSSRGYRILSRISRAGYSPGLTISNGRGFETDEQRAIYRRYFRLRHTL